MFQPKLYMCICPRFIRAKSRNQHIILQVNNKNCGIKRKLFSVFTGELEHILCKLKIISVIYLQTYQY